jgi:hypothetical protein
MIPNKKKFLIDVVAKFHYGRGGTISLYSLCHYINLLGGEAYVTHPRAPSFLNAPYLKINNEYDVVSEDYIVVYPPSRKTSNYYNAKNVVRWVMEETECFTWNFNELNTQDLFFSFDRNYFHPPNVNYCGILKSHFFDMNLVKQTNFQDRTFNKSCVLIKKGFRNLNKIHPPDAVRVDNFQTDWVKMTDILNKSRYLYCYDLWSSWPMMAAACGCVGIVVPDFKKKITPTEYYEASLLFSAGVAYGTDQKEIDRAKSTMHLVPDILANIQKKDLESIERFMNICYNHF